MALVRTFNLLTLRDLTRYNPTNVTQFYATIPPHFAKPIYKKDEIKQLTYGEKLELNHLPIRPSYNNETSSEFHDPKVNKFINYVMRKGNKILARKLVEQTFENIKRLQFKLYNNTSPEEKEYIELDPKKIFHKAIKNCTPILGLQKIRKGGIVYQVPVPLNPNKCVFLSMNWLIETTKQKDSKRSFPEELAKELIDAAKNQGRTVKKKQDLHKRCEANRAYAHFRWAKAG